MNDMKKVKINTIRNQKGSSLIQVVMVLTVLLILAVAIVSLSLTGVTVNAKDQNNNKSYYAAEACVQKGLEQTKYEMAKYYDAMIEAESSDFELYYYMYNNFFANIATNAQSTYSAPVFEDSSYNGSTLNTTFSQDNIDLSENTGDLIIRSTYTLPDGSSRKVQGTLNIKRIDVLVTSENWCNFKNYGLAIGGDLILDTTNVAYLIDGNAILGGLVYENDDFVPLIVTNGIYEIQPDISQHIKDTLSYPSFPDYVMESVNLYAANGVKLKGSDLPAAPVYIQGNDNASFTIQDCTLNGGAVCSKGDLTLKSCTINGDVYCEGDLLTIGATINGNIYCRGNAEMQSQTITGDLWCDGDITLKLITELTGNIYCGGTIDAMQLYVDGGIFATDNIAIDRVDQTKGVIYTSSDLFIDSCTCMDTIIFAGGNIDIKHDIVVEGLIITKGDIDFVQDGHKTLNITYDEDGIKGLALDSSFSFFFPNSNTVTSMIPVENLILSERIIEIN